MNDHETPQPLKVLVLCTANSARSQIAESLLRARGAGRVLAESAGTHPAARVNPGAIAVLAEHGLKTAERAPQGIDAVLDRGWDLVVTVCDDAKESCPIFPGAPRTVHWGVPDPAGAPDEPAAFRRAFDILAYRVDRFLALLPLRAAGPTLHDELKRIGSVLPEDG